MSMPLRPKSVVHVHERMRELGAYRGTWYGSMYVEGDHWDPIVQLKVRAESGFEITLTEAKGDVTMEIEPEKLPVHHIEELFCLLRTIDEASR